MLSRRVGAVLGLGQAEAGQHRAVGDRRQQPLALLFAAGSEDHLGREHRDQQQVGGIEVAGAQLLGGNPGRDGAGPLPTVGLGDRDPGQAELAHFRARARIDLPALVVGRIAPGQALARESPHALLEVALLVAQPEVHRLAYASGHEPSADTRPPRRARQRQPDDG